MKTVYLASTTPCHDNEVVIGIFSTTEKAYAAAWKFLYDQGWEQLMWPGINTLEEWEEYADAVAVYAYDVDAACSHPDPLWTTDMEPMPPVLSARLESRLLERKMIESIPCKPTQHKDTE